MVREKHALDARLLIVAVALVLLGILFIYDASFVRAGQMRFTGYDPQYFLKRQMMWACLGAVAMVITMYVPYWKLDRLAVAGMAITVILLLAVMVIGTESNGARRWFAFGPVRFQPSEFAKLAVVLFLAQWLTVNQRRVRHLTRGFLPLVAGLGGVGVLVAMEPDLGTALVVVGVGTLMLFVGGARKRHMLLLGALGIVAVLILIWIEPYRMERITSWIDPYADVQGSGYQVVHSLIALGSGGPLGVGLGQGRQKYFYLPAEHTDYILGTIGEELGLIGTLLVLGGFFYLAMRGFTIAHRTRDPFGSLMASGLSMLIALQAILNIGVVTKALPSTGVPLPFISYGGSSLVLTMIAVGMLLNISQYPSAPSQATGEGKDYHEDTADRRRNRRSRLSSHRYR